MSVEFWRISMRRVFFVIGLALFAQPAIADVQDYCAAVARDFADLRPKDRDIWQQRYDNASADCIEQFSAPALTAAAPPKPRKKLVAVAPSKPQPVASKVIPKPKSKKPTTEVATVEGTTAEPTAKADVAKPKPVVGGPEWLDYCTRKYTSFDKKKGTYLSKTGVERKCLVTADFK
jgi:BA14K-like protein